MKTLQQQADALNFSRTINVQSVDASFINACTLIMLQAAKEGKLTIHGDWVVQGLLSNERYYLPNDSQALLHSITQGHDRLSEALGKAEKYFTANKGQWLSNDTARQQLRYLFLLYGQYAVHQDYEIILAQIKKNA